FVSSTLTRAVASLRCHIRWNGQTLCSSCRSAVEIVHYDPKFVGVDAKKAFPFRNM
ncbi:hypothetical protein MKX01_022819, partial [Papaver californicum]